MAINPIKYQKLNLPNTPLPGVRPDPQTWRNLAGIGGDIGDYVQRRGMAEALQGATDPTTGNLDLTKAAGVLALRDPANANKYLGLLEAKARADAAESYRRESLASTNAYHQAQIANMEAQRKLAQDQFDRGTEHLDPGGLGRDPSLIRVPRNAPPVRIPIPGGGSAMPVPTEPDAVVKPQSALEPDLADPEQAPPYRVAGPPMPPPAAVAPAAPAVAPPVAATAPPAAIEPAAPTPAAGGVKPPINENYMKQLHPTMAPIVRELVTLNVDPHKLPYKDEDKAALFQAARYASPGWSPERYGENLKRREADEKKPTLSPEMAARIGMGSDFINQLGDVKDSQGNVIPGIRSRIAAGELNKDWSTAVQAQAYKGGPGEIRKKLDSGAEALVRMLTGAGMNKEEIADYNNRFKFRLWDTPKETLNNVADLERVLTAVQSAVSTGKTSPEDIRKALNERLGERQPSPFPAATADTEPVRQVKNDEETSSLVGNAQEALRNGTRTREFLLKDLRRRGVHNPESYL